MGEAVPGEVESLENSEGADGGGQLPQLVGGQVQVPQVTNNLQHPGR